MAKTPAVSFRVELPALDRTSPDVLKRSLRESRSLTPRLLKTMIALIDFTLAGMTEIAWRDLAHVVDMTEAAVQRDVRALRRKGLIGFSEPAPAAESGTGEIRIGTQAYVDALDRLLETGDLDPRGIERECREAGFDMPTLEWGMPDWQQRPAGLRLLLVSQYLRACDRFLERQRNLAGPDRTQDHLDYTVLMVIFKHLLQLDRLRLEREVAQ